VPVGAAQAENHVDRGRLAARWAQQRAISPSSRWRSIRPRAHGAKALCTPARLTAGIGWSVLGTGRKPILNSRSRCGGCGNLSGDGGAPGSLKQTSYASTARA